MEPEPKRPRLDDDEDEKDGLNLDLNTAIQEIDYGYLMEIELDFSSERQKKSFKRIPSFPGEEDELSRGELQKLSEADKILFRNAKASEVSSFLKTEAVRRCLSVDEENQAKESQRILRARWVLVWKPIPEEDRAEAQEKALQAESA